MKHYIKLVQLFYRLYLTSPNIGVVCNGMVVCISSKTIPNFIIISKVMATTLYIYLAAFPFDILLNHSILFLRVALLHIN